MMQDRRTYEIMDAQSIGLKENRLVLGKHSGRHAFEQRLKEMGYTLGKEELERAFHRFKEAADKKKELFDEDLEAIVSDEVSAVPEQFHLQCMNVFTSLDGMPTATLKLTNGGGEELIDSGIGIGSVDAVYKTIDKLVDLPHKLVDYTVKSVTGGTDAFADVTVKLGDDGNIYTGRGTSLDIVEASAKAYLHAINKLVYYRARRMKNE
jgi:2-isopropylmalate synthase